MENDDLPDYHPRPRQETRYPPRVVQAGPPPDEDYFALTGRHGRPFGVFDKERKLPYGNRA